MDNQEAIFLQDNKILVQDKKAEYYVDDVYNFKQDYGKPFKYFTIDYNKQAETCIVNGKVQEYPNEEFEELIKFKDVLLQRQKERTQGKTTLEIIKENKIAEFKAIRDTEEQSPIAYNGYRWDFDDKAIQRINGAIIALANGGEITWTSSDNQEIRGVTADDLRGVIGASAVRSNALHVKYRELRERVEQAETKEQVEAIKW